MLRETILKLVRPRAVRHARELGLKLRGDVRGVVERAASRQTLRSGSTFAAIVGLIEQSMEDRADFVWECISDLLEDEDFADQPALRRDLSEFLGKELRLASYHRSLRDLTPPAGPGSGQLSHADKQIERRRASILERIDLEVELMIHNRARQLSSQRAEADPRVLAVLLETDQETLLETLVEALRRVPSDGREAFIAGEMEQGPGILHHPGLLESDRTCHMGDIEILIAQRLLQPVGRSKGIVRFDVAPLGFRYYAYARSKQGQPLHEAEQTILSYLDGQSFQKSYGLAYSKWTDAAQLLWSSQPEPQFTNIGHLCREATQEFAETLAKRYGVEVPKQGKSKTAARLRAVLDKISGELSDTVTAFLSALLDYWGCLCDLVQRQEHDVQKEGGSLLWEDARRVVFQTAIVMFEIDRATSRLAPAKRDEDV